MNQPIVVWLRRDLRLADHPALWAAAKTGSPIVLVYVWDPENRGCWAMGEASRWWLHHSLKALQASIREKELFLAIRKGNPKTVLASLLREVGASSVFFNRDYTPLDEQILHSLPSSAFHGSLLFEPCSIMTKEGKPFQVFTPFYNACSKHTIEEPYPIPSRIRGVKVKGLSLEDLGLLPKIGWDADFSWQAGEEAALSKLKQFIKKAIRNYSKDRDFPALEGSSLLSPHLHFGEISPRTVWKIAKGHDAFCRQIIWREFAHHLLFFFPKTALKALHSKYDDFPWKKNSRLLHIWAKGLTGYPIVDAGMRQLWKTGWMHNRVRMIVASFLVKDLMIPWQEGAKWFWDTLVDADVANNTLGWQWAAGCGADAAPFFRIFNPVLQGEKFDPEGEYVKRFVPELKNLPKKWIHRPWEAPQDVLEKANVSLTKTYPKPIVDHETARIRALEMYRKWK